MTLAASPVKAAEKVKEKKLRKSILSKKKHDKKDLPPVQEFGGTMQKPPQILLEEDSPMGNQASNQNKGNTRRTSVTQRVSIVEPPASSNAKKRRSSSKEPGGVPFNRKSMRKELDDGTVSGSEDLRRQEAYKSLDLLSLKYKGQALAKGFMRFQRRRSTVNLYSNNEAMNVLTTIQEQMQRRKQEQIIEKLDRIRQRVQRTLENVDMDMDSESEEEPMDTTQKPKPLYATFFDTKAEREKMNERNYVIEKVETFEDKALLKKQYLTELALWFEEKLDMCNDVITPEDMKDLILNTQELHNIISNSLEMFMKNSEGVVEKGKLLLAETSKIIADRKEQMSKRTKKERIIVYDEKLLLQDPEKWEMATKTVISVFEDSQKMIRNIMYKNALKLSQRQFEHMVAASERRNRDLDEKKKQCIELQGKLHSSRMQNDRAHREIEEQRKKVEKTMAELNTAKQTVDKHETRIKELNKEVYERNAKIKLLEEKLTEKMRTPTPPPTPPPPPEPETVFVKVVDSATELKLKEVEKELQEAHEEIKKLKDESRLVTEQLVADKERCKELQERVTELESMPTPEPVVISLPVTPAIETPVIPDHATDKDAQYYKTLMKGMKKDFAVELEKVKAHIVKEKSRNEAGVRKMELQHKEQLSNIQKDILRMLRGILHFRDSMRTCLEKESLFDHAQSMQELGDLVRNKMSPDPKELLAVIVSTVIDYLHNMEGILNNAFKAMRILMKYQVERQVEAEVELRMSKIKQEQETKKVAKEVRKKQEVLVGAQKGAKHITKRLKKARNKLKRFQKELEHGPADKRYRDLLQRYNHVINMYTNMSKEMENLQSDFHETMERKLEEKETMVVTQMKMEMKQQRAVTEEQLKISILDKKENLRLLSKAFDENKIPTDLYKMASSMIKNAIELPKLKLRNLLEQYITFKTVQESKVRVQQVLKDDDLDIEEETRKEMENYLHQMDEKLDSSMIHWRAKMKQLDIQKRELNRQIFNLFNEVLMETGVVLVHPMLKDSNKRNIMAQAAGTMTRSRMQQLLVKRNKTFKTFMDMPEMIQGSSIPLKNTGKPAFLDLNLPPCEPITRVMDPHLLMYHINQPKIQATRHLHHRRNAISLNYAASFHINTLPNLRYRDDPFNSRGGFFPPISL